MARRPRWIGCALAVLAACGGGGGGGQATRETWVVSRMALPTTQVTAQADAFDVDGNGTPDNALGGILVALTSGTSVDLQAGADRAILTGGAVQLVETHTGASTSVAFLAGTPAIAPCASPSDTLCGRHLNGTTSFTADPPPDPALTGSGTADAFQAGPGALHLELPIFGSPPAVLPLVKARASFTRAGAGLVGKVGGAIPQAAVDGVLLPNLQAWIASVVAQDCPGGVCVPGSTGDMLLQAFDADHDGAVTLAELQTNALLSSLLAPDVDTDGNGTPDALSMGIGLDLVGAVF